VTTQSSSILRKHRQPINLVIMSFKFLTDPDQSISERFFGTTNIPERHSCKICGGYVDTLAKDGIKPLMKHLRDAECKGFRESVRALRMADNEGTELCPLNTATTAYKERCTQLEISLRLAVRELDQLGSPLAKDPTMRQLVQPQASMRLASVSTSTSISQATRTKMI
jgi:hypothetical protein